MMPRQAPGISILTDGVLEDFRDDASPGPRVSNLKYGGEFGCLPDEAPLPERTN